LLLGSSCVKTLLKILVKSTPWVNFIYILRARFLYKSALPRFSLYTFWPRDFLAPKYWQKNEHVKRWWNWPKAWGLDEISSSENRKKAFLKGERSRQRKWDKERIAIKKSCCINSHDFRRCSIKKPSHDFRSLQNL